MRRVLCASALLLAPQLAAAASVGPGGIPFSIAFTATFLGEDCGSPTGAPDPAADYVCDGVGLLGDGGVAVTNPAGAYRGLFHDVRVGSTSAGTITGTAVEITPGRYEADTVCILFDGLSCPTDYPPGHAFIELTRRSVDIVLGANTETRFRLSGPEGTAEVFEDLYVADYRARFALSAIEASGLPSVPLPASLPLLALGAAGIVAVTRRRGASRGR